MNWLDNSSTISAGSRILASRMDVSVEAQKHPLSTLSPYSYIPPRREEPKEMSYFNNDVKAPEILMYDRVLHQAEGYDNKLHRDDRVHTNSRGLDICQEEMSRAVAVRSSSEYGRRQPPALYQPSREHVRVAHIKSEFFQKNGITRNVAEGYGSVTPV